MAAGYEWHPIFRFTPENGFVSHIDARTAFSDAGGPTRIRLGHQPEQEAWIDVNRTARARTWGFRLDASMTFDIVDMTDQQQLATILNRLARQDYAVALSLDAGAVYHDVLLVGHRGPDALGGKTFVGARYELTVRGAELLDEIPVIASLLGSPTVVSEGMSLPTPGPGLRWQIWIVSGGVGLEDVAYQCLKGAGGGYSWVPISAGGA